MNFSNITNELQQKINSSKMENRASSYGKILSCGDGVIKIDGLKSAKYNELLDIEGGYHAIALNLEENFIGAIVLEDDSKLSVGMNVYSSGKVVEIPVGEKLLGRVVDPLGRPLDGLSDIVTEKKRPAICKAPGVFERGKVNTPLQTGILAIDSMIPIGKGQRELIIGDRQTGKTAIAIDAIINQKGKDVLCVYVAIGQKASTVSSIVHTLAENDALSYTIVVASFSSDSVPLQYLAPFSGCAMAEEFMHNGKDVLIVYDDLTKHAVSYRQISLLLKRPPGREAYPGDIFYLHSGLLERSAKLSAKLGGGSITALPIVETLSGDISAYIPTNVISITDGQIYLETELFHNGIRPAVNVGLSVSRVGGSAQVSIIRKLAGKLRIDLAQYRELAIFAQFASDLDKSTKQILDNGLKMTQMLKQKQYEPLSVPDMAVLLYVLSNNLLENISASNISVFKKQFLEYLRTSEPSVFANIEMSKDISRDDGEKIKKAVTEYSDYLSNK